jgi:hypothetical protein
VQTPVHLQNEATKATVAAPTDSAAVAAFCRCPSPLLIPGRAASQPLPPLDPPASLFPSSRACSSSIQAAADRGIQSDGSTCSSSELHPAARGIQAGGSRPRRVEAVVDRGRQIKAGGSTCSSSSDADASSWTAPAPRRGLRPLSVF